MPRHDEIKASYKQLGNVGTMYEGIVTRSTLTGKLLDSLVWGAGQGACGKVDRGRACAHSGAFSGKLLPCLAYIGLFVIGSAVMAWVFTGMG